MLTVGADGCKGGWLAFLAVDGRGWRSRLYRNAGELWNECCGASRILVDIPIGLVDEELRVRQCDTEARKLLGPGRASSVFTPPSRPALAARTYQEACQINYRCTGKRLSKQAYSIMPKIREFDELLRDDPNARRVIRETHPEICFWAFAGRPMRHNKKKPDGFHERLAVLTTVFSGTEEIVKRAQEEVSRKEAAKDDVLDAMAAAIAAASEPDLLRTIPVTPPLDTTGLPMEMVYPFVRRNAPNPCS